MIDGVIHYCGGLICGVLHYSWRLVITKIVKTVFICGIIMFLMEVLLSILTLATHTPFFKHQPFFFLTLRWLVVSLVIMALIDQESDNRLIMVSVIHVSPILVQCMININTSIISQLNGHITVYVLHESYEG